MKLVREQEPINVHVEPGMPDGYVSDRSSGPQQQLLQPRAALHANVHASVAVAAEAGARAHVCFAACGAAGRGLAGSMRSACAGPQGQACTPILTAGAHAHAQQLPLI